MKNKNYSIILYLQPIIIAAVFAFSLVSVFFAVLGIILLVLYYIYLVKVIKFYKRADDIDNYSRITKFEADNYKTKINNEINQKKAELESLIINKNNEVLEKEKLLKTLEKVISDRKTELENSEKEIIVSDSNFYIDYDISSAEYKDKFSLSQLKEKELVKNGYAINITSRDTKTVINANIKQILRCFNSETAAIIKSVTIKNVDTLRNRLVKSFEMLNKIYKVDGVQLTDKILEIKLEQLNLMYSYAVILNNEKEEQKAIREQMLEEEKVRREIEREKAKLDKEETQFKKEIDKLMAYMQKADSIEKQLYVDKIKELEEKLKLLEKDKENVLEREQNTRAGFVYIISNIGSFGENIYKIGMTRRLEPMDRIKELSSASVPFEFDVHAMIFSEDAPKLETALHNYFDNRRVNKVNERKEFFNVTLNEIEKVVKENHNATVTFTKTALAEQYRQTLKLIEKAQANDFENDKKAAELVRKEEKNSLEATLEAKRRLQKADIDYDKSEFDKEL